MKRFKSEVTALNDKELLELLKTDPQKGLAELVQYYGRYILKIAHSKLGDVCTHEDIEEAVSDILMLFYKSAEKSGFEIKSVKAYISVISARHCVNVFEKMSRRQAHVSFEDISDTVADTESDPEALRLAEAVKALGEPDSEIFIRKYFLGQKSAEIGQQMNMKANTVDKRISRGLVKLRKMLEDETL